MEQLERYHRTKLPPVDVRFSDHITQSLCLRPITSDLDGLHYRQLHHQSQLKSHGLDDAEIGSLNRRRFTVFLATGPAFSKAQVYAAAWHELAHVVADHLGILDWQLNEGFAIAHQFRGLLEAANLGTLTRPDVDTTIELALSGAMRERRGFAASGIWIPLPPQDPAQTIHYVALRLLREHNPELKFRGRESGDLLRELDQTLDHVLRTWRWQKYSEPFSGFLIVLFLMIVAIVLLVIRSS